MEGWETGRNMECMVDCEAKRTVRCEVEGLVWSGLKGTVNRDGPDWPMSVVSELSCGWLVSFLIRAPKQKEGFLSHCDPPVPAAEMGTRGSTFSS